MSTNNKPSLLWSNQSIPPAGTCTKQCAYLQVSSSKPKLKLSVWDWLKGGCVQDKTLFTKAVCSDPISRNWQSYSSRWGKRLGDTKWLKVVSTPTQPRQKQRWSVSPSLPESDCVCLHGGLLASPKHPSSSPPGNALLPIPIPNPKNLTS